MSRLLKTLTAALVLTVLAPVFAIELTLAENRGESGSIGYVDVEQIFKKHPETVRVKSELEKEISKREEQLIARRQELYALRADLEKLRLDREILRRKAAAEEAKAAAEAAAAMCPVPPLAPAKPPAVSTEADANLSTAAIARINQDIAMAETLTETDAAAAAAEAKISSAPEPAAIAAAEVKVSSEPAPAVSIPAEVKVSSVPVIKTPVPSRIELDALEEKIADTEVQVLNRETVVEEYRQRAEKELLAYEQRRMELILGRIYFVLREVAINEGVSVVVDKKSILYGQNAVDLTGKLLKKLSQE